MVSVTPHKVQKIKDLIAAGKVDAARRELALLTKKKLPRDLIVEVADLARRLSEPLIAIRILNPVVRPHPRKPLIPNEHEKAEYAANLIAIGAGSEGESLLDQVDERIAPLGLLFRAFACFSQWRYTEAIPYLKRYISSPRISEYEVYVGKVNLAAALSSEQWDPSTPDLLAEIRDSTRAKGFFRLCANAYELSAQNEIHEQNWRNAERYLSEAERLFDSAGTLDAFFIYKWRTIAKALRSKGSVESIAALVRLKEQAGQREHWETVRECDLYRSLCTKDRELALYLFFGTPFEGYRERILRRLPFALNIPEFYDRRVGKVRARSSLLDLRAHFNDEPRSFQLPSSKLRDLVSCLASDFYRPFRIASLSSILYPNEYYHPEHSPQRIYQLLRRLRRWVEKTRLPLRIIENHSTYRLDSRTGIRIRVIRARANLDLASQRLEILRSEFGKGEFSVTEASRAIRTSAATALRALNIGRTRGLVESRGCGPSTVYQLIPR